jgi:UDPglucose 6-dehydrogenase
VQISVLGTGYLGATHAAVLAACGHTVIGVDTNPERLDRLRRGRAPFHEPGLDDLLLAGVRAGRLCFTDDLREAAGAEVHFLCVGTPQAVDDDRADLSALWSVTEALAPLLDAGCLVVGKSTVPVGTAALLRDRVRELAPAGEAVSVAWNPEFLREGYGVEDTLRPDRLVFGVKSEWAQEMLEATYKGVYELGAAEDREVPTVITDFPTAELVKVAANSYLATKISFINAMAEVSEAARSATTSGSATSSSAPASASVAAASPRTSARSRPGPPSSASARRCGSSPRSTRSTSAGVSGRSASPPSWSAVT